MKFSTVLLSTFFQFGIVILGINCINLGLISPIEVVEEWGCHDTEIRLTCGHLDSKLAILEATFTPNCTHEDCLRLDIKRLARAFHTTPKPKISSRRAETEAGRRFLEALKKSPHTPDENLEEVVVIDSSEKISEDPSSSSVSDEYVESNLANLLTEQLNARKASLRASLERLIIRYLRKLSPEENFDYDMRKRSLRTKRNMRKKRVKRMPKSSGELMTEKSFTTKSSQDQLEEDSFSKGANLRINLGERTIIVNETDPDEREFQERENRFKETRQYCPEQQRKVSSLDRFDLERSYRNESAEEYNIRRLLNRRCSGKNHCSFIFNIDHPFSKVWESGTVRIKYVCMEDFRVNHYCGQRLNIGYELSPKEQLEQHGGGGRISDNEPIAEARVARDQTSAYHSVKILRAGDELDIIPQVDLGKFTVSGGSGSTASDSRKRKIKIHNPVIEQKEVKDNKGVYSQDFKVLKILPSDIDDLNDLEKVGDEIYFRKDKNILEGSDDHTQKEKQHQQQPPSSTTQDTFHSYPSPSISSAKPSPTVYLTSEGTILHYPAPNYPETPSKKYIDDNSNWLIPTDDEVNTINNGNNSKFENYTITIREGDQYVIIFPQATPSPPTSTTTETLYLDNLMIGREKPSTLNQTTTQSTLDQSNDRNSSNVEYEATFLLSSTISTANISEISSTISIDFSSDFTTLTASNTTSVPSTTSESTGSGVFIPSHHDTTTASTKHDNEFIENEIEDIGPTISELLTTRHHEAGESPDDGIIYDESKQIKIELPESTAYDEDADNGTFDSIDDDDDDDEDYDMVYPTRSTYSSIQKTIFRKPLLHGFMTTPGYPKFYIGESECKWKIVAPDGQKIRLTILDISLRIAEPLCMDFIEIIDLNAGRNLFNSCSEEIRPQEVISDSHQVEVIVKTTSKFAYPKRGVLLHYSALGCVDPPLPADGNLVKRTETTNYYECKEGYVFPDSLTNSRQLLCTERHTWNRILPDCIEELAIAENGFIFSNYNIKSRKRPPEKDDSNIHIISSKNTTKMSDKDADMVFDIIIPTLLIAGLFVLNGFIFAVIIYYRRRNKTLEGNNVELAEL